MIKRRKPLEEGDKVKLKHAFVTKYSWEGSKQSKKRRDVVKRRAKAIGKVVGKVDSFYEVQLPYEHNTWLALRRDLIKQQPA